MSSAILEALYTAYVAALEAADYASAISYLLRMRPAMLSTPDVTHSIGSGNRSVQWNIADLDSELRHLKQLQTGATHASAGIFQQSKVVYARADAVNDY